MNRIEEYLLSIIPIHPSNAIRKTMEKFGITRAAVHRHLNKLKKKNLVLQTGSRNKVKYSLVQSKSDINKSSRIRSFTYKVGEKDESAIWSQDIKKALPILPHNIEKICEYGLTEIYNNVIDHSESENAQVDLSIDEQKKTIEITVTDLGIGIFKKVAQACGFNDYREAIIRISKGKFTTDRSKHSGEGIFFTSKVFDQFSILANGLFYFTKYSHEYDWYFESRANQDNIGTCVSMTISIDSSRQLSDIFNQFTNPENFKFDKTHMRISLTKFEEDEFVSRSQAKRLLNGLNEFKTITLDFAGVKSVGQAFVDEVFGVFSINNPAISFHVINANSDVLFMIKRGLANREELNHKVVFTT